MSIIYPKCEKCLCTPCACYGFGRQASNEIPGPLIPTYGGRTLHQESGRNRELRERLSLALSALRLAPECFGRQCEVNFGTAGIAVRHISKCDEYRTLRAKVLGEKE